MRIVLYFYKRFCDVRNHSFMCILIDITSILNLLNFSGEMTDACMQYFVAT